MMSPLLSAVVAAVLPLSGVLSVDASTSHVTYHITHKLHRVQGHSSSIEGKALVRDGQVLAMVRIPIASFRSGDGNRDVHMQETLHVEQYPYVVWKGVAPLEHEDVLPAGKVTLAGQLEFHGVSRPLTVPVDVEPQPDGNVRIRGTMALSLDDFRVERPSLLFIKIDDTCQIDVDFVLKAVQP